MSSDNSANFEPLVSREQAGNAIADALRLFVGRGRRYSVKQLSNATGVKDRMIECAMCSPASVDFRPLPDHALISISKFLGPAFTNEWLGLADQSAAYAEESTADDLAVACAEYTLEYTRSRHTNSECGTELGPMERELLTRLAQRKAIREAYSKAQVR